MKLALFYTLLILSIAAGCSRKNTSKPEALTLEDLLVKSNEISGWQRTGQHWSAGSSSELTNCINGEAVIYTNHGFTEGTEQGYQGKLSEHAETLELRIFNQGNTANAKAVFDEIVSQMSSPVDWKDGAGQAAKIERYTLAQRIVFYKSKYFIALSISTGQDAALDILKTFANNVDHKIQ